MARRLVTVLVLVVSLGALTPPGPIDAAPGESSEPGVNPDLDRSCGLDVNIILDESGSIGGDAGNVRTAFRAFVGALKNTGSRLAVEEFSSTARLPSIGGAPGGTYVTIDDSSEPDFEAYINTYSPGGGTNWEDAFRAARYFAPRPTLARPHLVVFITDGNPKNVIRNGNGNNQVTYDPGNPNLAQNEYELKVPLADAETSNLPDNETGYPQGALPAISNANALKTDGSHVLAVGVGRALGSAPSQQRLQDVSGPDVYDGTGAFDIVTDDVYLEPDFSELAGALREAAFQLCAPSVSIRKLVDDTPDPGTLDDAVPGVGWELTGTVTSPPPDQFEWVLPTTAVGSGAASAVTTTDAAGFSSFQWTPSSSTASSSFELAETIQPGYTNLQSATNCTFRTPDTADAPLPITVVDGGFTAGDIPPESIVTCQIVNVAVPDPGIEIVKTTNGADGLFIPVGEPITWTYVVTNTGNTTLDGLTVADDQLGPIACPSTTIAVGASVTCTQAGTAVAGQYDNIGTATATDTYGTVVDDTDPSSYFGADPGIDIEKSTQGENLPAAQDADLPPGPFIDVGDTVTWTYVVTNTGNEDLSDIVVTDDQEGAITCPANTLAVGASFTCTATGTAQAGQYANVARVTSTAPDGSTPTDDDPSHYFGADAGVALEKSTNGVDADDPADAPVVPVGGAVAWTYEITNTGNVPLQFGELVDDPAQLIACPTVLIVFPGQTVTCRAFGTAEAGLYRNDAFVELTDPNGNLVGSEDPSHYQGVTSELTIEKATNTIDADNPTGPFVPVGDQVTWSYVVTNTGDTELTDLAVVDLSRNGIEIVDCDGATPLPPGQSRVCTPRNGTAEPAQYVNAAVARAFNPFGERVFGADPSHYFGADSAITLEKTTNGVDADTAPGPLVPVGGQVIWEYRITNTGNDALTDIVLEDDVLGPVDCPPGDLAPGETKVCSVTGAAVRGQYTNVGTVTAVDQAQQPVTDTDPSNHFGYLAEIDVEKATNGVDADTPTGPTLQEGDAVTWTYVVTNEGDLPLVDVVLVDDQIGTLTSFTGDTGNDLVLDVGETWTYTATGTAVVGQYANTADVTARVANEGLDLTVADSDPSHYIGEPAPLPPVPTDPQPTVPTPLPTDPPITPPPTLSPILPATGSDGTWSMLLVAGLLIGVGGTALVLVRRRA